MTEIRTYEICFIDLNGDSNDTTVKGIDIHHAIAEFMVMMHNNKLDYIRITGVSEL